MKVGDLVRSIKPGRGLVDRSGIIVSEVQRSGSGPKPRLNKIFKVLWNAPSPVRPSFTGASWDHDLEVISEGR